VSPLKGARIVPAASASDISISYASAAADYLDELISEKASKREDAHLALTGNQTILKVVSSLPDRKRPNAHFYAAAIFGHSTRTLKRNAVHVGPETNATIAWARSGNLPGHLDYATIPPVDLSSELEMPSSPERQKRIQIKISEHIQACCEDYEEISTLLQDMEDNINIALVGIGTVNPKYETPNAERTMTGLLRGFGIEAPLLEKDKVSGDIAYCMFDKYGKGRDEWKLFLTPGDGVEFYRNLCRRGHVIVCDGMRNLVPLRIAIETGLANILIADVETANALLQDK
jgi:DNA-binding transcriptional regulator LsrR (DeoR family)